MENNLKILISSRSFGKIDSGALEQIKNANLEPIINPYGRKMSEDEILSMSGDVVGIIAGTEKISENIISALEIIIFAWMIIDSNLYAYDTGLVGFKIIFIILAAVNFAELTARNVKLIIKKLGK